MTRRTVASTADTLTGVPYHAPAAGTFVFLDLRERAATDEDAMSLIEQCLDAGVSLTPGSAFGERFGRFARLCYTATSLDEVRDGCQRITPILGG